MATGTSFSIARDVSVFLMAENRLLRESLSRLLAKRQEFRMAGEDTLSEAAIKAALASKCEIVVMNCPASNQLGYNIIVQLLRANPGLKILLVGMEDDEQSFWSAVRAGASGYLINNASASDVVSAVHAVAQGEGVCPPRRILSLFQFANTQLQKIPMQRSRMDLGLTRRHQEMVTLVAKGLTNKEIGEQLHISEQTVKNHVRRILEKLKVANRHEAVETLRTRGYAI
jgi:two-component system, NarL family, response regulator DevR